MIWSNERWLSFDYTLASNNCLYHRHVFQNEIQNFEYFVPYDFVQILPEYGPNTRIWSKYLMYGEILYFHCPSVSNDNIKCPIGKSIFAVNLPWKLFRAAVANAYTWRLKSICTFIDTYLDHILAKFKPNRRSEMYKILNFCDEKASFLKTICDKLLTCLTPFCKTFL